jgi:hypothetical protein
LILVKVLTLVGTMAVMLPGTMTMEGTPIRALLLVLVMGGQAQAQVEKL